MKEKIKILHVIYSVCIGGAETQLINILRNFLYDRYEVFVACPKGDLSKFVSNIRNVHLYNIEFESKCSLKSALEIKKIILENSIDIVHSHLLRSTINCRLAKLLSNTPVLLATNLHNSLIRANVGLFQKYFNLTVDAITGRLDDVAITVSNSLRRDLIKIERYKRNKVVTVYNGVNLDDYFKKEPILRNEFKLNDSDILVGYVGRLHRQKGIEYFLKSIPLILKKADKYSVKFIIVGDGPSKDYLVRLSKKLGIQSSAHFLGFRDDIPNILSSFDIMVSPSLYEGLPVALLEASAAQIPIVATNIDGNNEVVEDNVTGLLVSARSHIKLAEAVSKLIFNPKKRNEFGQKARERVKGLFTINRTISELDRIYTKLLLNKYLALHK